MTKTLHEFLQLSPEEEAILKHPILKNSTPEAWKEFAGFIIEALVKSYSEGQIFLEDVIENTWKCSIGCAPQTRLGLYGLASAQARKNAPAERIESKPRNPEWLIDAAVKLVLMLEEHDPNISVGHQKPGSSINKAIEQLTLMRLAGAGTEQPLAPKTLYDRVIEFKRATGLVIKNRGPKKKK